MTKFKHHWITLTPDKKRKLVEATGIPNTYMSSIAYGRVNPTLSTMAKIVDADSKVKFTWFVEPDPD